MVPELRKPLQAWALRLSHSSRTQPGWGSQAGVSSWESSNQPCKCLILATPIPWPFIPMKISSNVQIPSDIPKQMKLSFLLRAGRVCTFVVWPRRRASAASAAPGAALTCSSRCARALSTSHGDLAGLQEGPGTSPAFLRQCQGSQHSLLWGGSCSTGQGWTPCSIPARAQGQPGVIWASEGVPAHGMDWALRTFPTQTILGFCARCEEGICAHAPSPTKSRDRPISPSIKQGKIPLLP